MYYIYWIIIGIVAGFIASQIVNRRGEGMLLDLFIGILGAFIGSWLFNALGVGVPVGGILGTILVAFVGAVVLLVLLRILRASGKSRS